MPCGGKGEWLLGRIEKGGDERIEASEPVIRWGRGIRHVGVPLIGGLRRLTIVWRRVLCRSLRLERDPSAGPTRVVSGGFNLKPRYSKLRLLFKWLAA